MQTIGSSDDKKNNLGEMLLHLTLRIFLQLAPDQNI